VAGLALQPEEAAVPRHAEAAVLAVPLRAAAAVRLRAEAVGELRQRAEAASRRMVGRTLNFTSTARPYG
jgi:hypothetical protein